MNLFAEDDYDSGCLDDLVVGVIVGWNHGRAGVGDGDAALGERPVLRAVKLVPAIFRGALRGALAGFGG